MDLLKLATMMGMGRVIQSTPQMAHRDPTNFPAAVSGATSPYPGTLSIVILSVILYSFVCIA